MTDRVPNFGPTGQVVYERSYARTKPDGTKENWFETTDRVIKGNLGLVYGSPETWGAFAKSEYSALKAMMDDFKVIPAGRHLWASGVPGRQFLFNPVVGDSLVLTRQGNQKIKDLVGQTIDVLSMSDEVNVSEKQWRSVGTWRPATFINSGEQETYKVIFESGREVVSTAEHVWYATDSRRKLTTLELEGHSVPVMYSPRPEEDADYWVGVMRGIIFGDGSVGSNEKAYIRIHADEKLELLNIFEKFGHRVAIHSDGVGYVGRLPKEWKTTMPSLEDSASTWRGFFVGWFAADGCVDARGVSNLHNKSKDVLEYAIQGFELAGISTGNVKLSRELNPYNGEIAHLYCIGINRFSLTEQDFIQESKRSRFGAVAVHNKTKKDKVISVVTTGLTEPVYCCLEPATKSWTVNGVLTGNCHVSHWNEKITDHFDFSFMRLMEGGGVGTNYSTKYIDRYPAPKRELKVHIVCDPAHPDYQKMFDAGIISTQFSHEWAGAFAVGDSREGWSDAMCDLIDTYFLDDVKHYDRVYNVTGVREEGRPLVSFGGTASGPMPLAIMLQEIAEIVNKRAAFGQQLTPIDMMEIDHSLAMCVVSGGNRRSARMAMVAWDDPYIMEFINCKTDSGKHWTTNISVAIDDDFIKLINSDRFPDNSWNKRALEVYEAAIKGMITNGEPGFWNYSLANHGELAEIVCTNPCGEIGLREWEACILGHINLDAFAPTQFGQEHDFEGMVEAHKLMTRFLIRASFGDKADPKQQDMVNRNRRIGVGHFGVAGFLAKLGIRYSDAPKGKFFPQLLRELYQVVKDESADYAFKLRIPAPVANTTMAPTGSIAKLVGATEGAQPPYAKRYKRRVQFSTINAPEQIQKHIDEGYEVEDSVYSANTKVVSFIVKEKLVDEVEKLGYDADFMVQSQDELSLEEMLSFQEMYQINYVDNAISYTANIPEDKYTVEELKQVIKPFLTTLKGTTIMVDGTRPQAPYLRLTKEEYDSLSGPKSIEDSTDEECASGACPIR
jgi:adenosylcobalamin-dependent ribonucleoside-triphosphate reductase